MKSGRQAQTMSPQYDPPESPADHHPDLSNEVAALSFKLISAINNQTSLDDILSATRHELEVAGERIRQLELEAKEHAGQITRGLLVKSDVVHAERERLLASLAEEKKQRQDVEREKKNIEQELENLTQALFEEANKMVTNAREEASKDHDTLQRKNDQLRSQLTETESLLRSHQEQLAELKLVMEQMSEDRDDQTNPTAPSTPGINKFDGSEEGRKSSSGPDISSAGDILPSYPTSFTHLLQPVLRTDLAAFDDFNSLLRMSRTLAAGSRASSGSYAGIGMGLALGGYTNHTSSPATPSNGSTVSITTPATTGSSPATPTTPASMTSNSSATTANVLTPLKETRFYKRALIEDIEPTLRLDTAPGLSWLARRTFLNAMCEGTLVVEPMPTSTAKLYIFACSLCGEARKDPAHMRTHRFRTSESDSAQRYPLCKYCLGRVRSSCGFLGFLRVLKDGHWRTDDEESERAAWEESVRLREQMFWCRIGGGVVPVSSMHNSNPAQGREKSPRESEDDNNEVRIRQDLSRDVYAVGEIRPRDVRRGQDVSNPDNVTGKEASIAQRKAKSLVMSKDDTAEGLWEASQADALSPVVLKENSTGLAGQKVNLEERLNLDLAQSFSSELEGRKDEQSLAITIPGAFG